MKAIITLVAVAAMTIQTSTLYGAESSHSAKQGSNKTMQMNGEKGDMSMMSQNMQKMMKQMDEIHATKDPKKRKQLMHEHMQTMHKGMKMMRGMGGGTMKGMMGDKKGNTDMMAKGMGNKMSAKEKGQRHQMMEQRMDMMQMMMEQMMESRTEEVRHDGNYEEMFDNL